MATRTPLRRQTAERGAGRTPGARELAAQATRDGILRAAIKIFAKHGFDGGRVEMISKAAKSYDRMIYYYFDSKEGLFIAVLEEIYRRFNEAEAGLTLDVDQPIEALKDAVRFALRYYRDNPEFVTLLNSENLHRGKHIVKSLRAREFSSPAVGIIDHILRIGAARGVLRPDVSARDLYLMVAAMGYFYQSNRYTLSAFLGEDLEAPEAFDRWEAFVIDAVLRTAASAGSVVELAA
jgi:AcrR family transcriptional regulator